MVVLWHVVIGVHKAALVIIYNVSIDIIGLLCFHLSDSSCWL
jgi:hypothetical protein